jgi:hypothetical protein
MPCNCRSAVVAVLFFAGCASFAPNRDPTPLNPTAVLETRMVNTGVQDFGAFDSTTISYTRANMQRSESSFTTPSGISRSAEGEMQVRIERLDRKTAWTLDAKNKKAIECPLKGCISPGTRKAITKPPEQDKTGDSGCRMKIGNTSLTVDSTGAKRNINGFDTEQYDIKWRATLRDNASRKSTSLVSIDLWAAPVTPPLQDALALERNYARARNKIAPTDVDQPVLPHELDTLINTYLSASVSPADRASFLAGMGKLDAVKGQPILMLVKWNLSGAACSMDESMKDLGDKPLFTFVSEVKSHKISPQHDSLFSPPRGYKVRK